MSEHEKIAIVRGYFDEVWNRGDLDAADDLIAPDFSVEGCGGAISGLEAVKLYISSYRAAYPKVHFTILSLLSEGDLVVACWVGYGLHCSSTSCEEATGHTACISTTGLSVYRIADGRIAEAWAGSDHRGAGTIHRLGIHREDAN